MPPAVSDLVDSAADYIQHWTKTELRKIQVSQSPICIPIKSGYRIGLFDLHVYANKKCDVSMNDQLVHTFENKRSAVLYAIYTIKHQYKTADTILKLDKEINKNYTDISAWRNHMIRARKKKDFDTVDIRQSRIEIAEKHLETAQNEISKIYLSAKYNKIWDL